MTSKGCRSEIENIKVRYEKRKKIDSNLYSSFNPGNLYITQQKERHFLQLLDKFGMNPLSGKKILEVGCGHGSWLRAFLNYGAEPENIHGVELIEQRVKNAKHISPNLNITEGNCEDLKFINNSFDIVLTSMVFTSILDSTLKKNIAKEIKRVLKNDGIIIWYDFRYDNPKNKDVKGIEKKEILSLFPSSLFYFRKVTLAPPIARMLAPVSFLLCALLEKIPLLRTHYFVIIRKKTYCSGNM